MLILKHHPETVEFCPVATDKDNTEQVVLKHLVKGQWTTVSDCCVDMMLHTHLGPYIL